MADYDFLTERLAVGGGIVVFFVIPSAARNLHLRHYRSSFSCHSERSPATAGRSEESHG